MANKSANPDQTVLLIGIVVMLLTAVLYVGLGSASDLSPSEEADALQMDELKLAKSKAAESYNAAAEFRLYDNERFSKLRRFGLASV